jgi:hypothetical protein
VAFHRVGFYPGKWIGRGFLAVQGLGALQQVRSKRGMRWYLVAALLASQFQLEARAELGFDFPTAPDKKLTPGSLCERPSEYRYPEGIAYCERAVKSELKAEIIRRYDNQLGYRVGQMDRQAFKIDHYIPLCAGGSNRPDNLWPQHESVYVLTDELEALLCEKMSEGRLQQAEAIKLIRRAKADPPKAREIIEALLGAG